MNYSDVEYQCKICHHVYVADTGITDCPNCGTGKSMQKERKGFSLSTEKPETDGTSGDSVETSSNKYPALKTIAGLYKILAFVVVISAVIVFFLGVSGLVSTASDERMLGGIVVVTIVFLGPISFITLLAMSEGIMLFVNMANDLSEVKGMGANRSDSVDPAA